LTLEQFQQFVADGRILVHQRWRHRWRRLPVSRHPVRRTWSRRRHHDLAMGHDTFGDLVDGVTSTT
jgi:hypothetical protein